MLYLNKKTLANRLINKGLMNLVAPHPGLEPGTCGLTVRRSNQLS